MAAAAVVSVARAESQKPSTRTRRAAAGGRPGMSTKRSPRRSSEKGRQASAWARSGRWPVRLRRLQAARAPAPWTRATAMCAHSLASAPRTTARRNAATATAVATRLRVAIRPVATSMTSHTRSARDPGSRLMASQNAWARVAGVFRGDGGEVTWRCRCPPMRRGRPCTACTRTRRSSDRRRNRARRSPSPARRRVDTQRSAWSSPGTSLTRLGIPPRCRRTRARVLAARIVLHADLIAR